MAYDTGFTNPSAPPIGIQSLGQTSGRLIKENEAIVNIADWLSEVVTLGSGVSLNINTSGASTDNVNPLNHSNKKLLFDTGFNVPLDTERTWDLVVDGVLQPRSRNASASAGGTDVGPADNLEGFLPVSTDVTSGAAGSTRWILQSRNYIKFRNSDETLCFISGVFTDPDSFSTNAVYIRAYKLNVIINNPVFIPQSAWNIDSFGAGALNPSGITLDFSKIQTVAFHSIKKSMSSFKVGFVIGESLYYAHEFGISNGLDSLPFQNLDLPIRCEGYRASAVQFDTHFGVFEYNRGVSLSVFTDTTAPVSNLDIKLYGASVESLGLSNKNYYPFSAGRGVGFATIGSRIPILSIRPLELCFSNKNRIIANLKRITSHSNNVDLNKGYVLEVIYNGALTNDSFIDVDTGNSCMSYDLSATAITGGVIVYRDSVYPNGSKTLELGEGSTNNFINGLTYTSLSFNNGGITTVTASDTITFVATPILTDARASIEVDWNEVV